MNTLKNTIAKRIENLKTVLYDIDQEKMLEDFNSLSFDLNSINFLSAVASRCHPKVWGDIYIQNHYDFLDEFRPQAKNEWNIWGWFLTTLFRESEKLKQMLIDNLQFNDRVVSAEELKLSFSKNSYVPIVLTEDENLDTTKTQRETYKNIHTQDKNNLALQVDDLLLELGYNKNTITTEKIVIDKNNANEFTLFLKDENKNDIEIKIVDFCVEKINQKQVATRQENSLGFTFLLPTFFKVSKDDKNLYRFESNDFSFEIKEHNSFNLEQDFRTLVNKYKQEILSDNKKIVRTSKYETVNKLFVDKSIIKSDNNTWEIVYFFDITGNTVASITIPQNKQKPKEAFMVETLINTIKHKQDL